MRYDLLQHPEGGQPMPHRPLALLTVALCLALAAAAAAAPAPGEKKVPPRPRLALNRSVWADLASGDEAKATRAVLALGQSSSREAVAFLKQHLRSVKANPKVVARLIRDLESDESATRAQAQEELEYLAGYVEVDLKKAFASAKGAELKARIETILSRIPRPNAPPPKANPKVGPGAAISIQNNNGVVRILINGQEVDLNPRPVAVLQGPPATWVRAVRAVAVLEAIGTPEARALLEQVAAGEKAALPTEQAKAALRRLKGE
jgi:hypothetical protein